jgi:hypothetical protein
MLNQVQHDEGTGARGTAKWHRALAAWRRADAAISAASHSQDEDLYDRLGARHDRALVRLLTTPAPDGTALADKLDLAIAHQIWELTAGAACLGALRRDARRLSRTASPPAYPSRLPSEGGGP